MNFDLIVIGSGPGGYVAAIRAAQLGMKVGVVEQSHLGGICLNWGCIPTKALLKSASVYSYIKDSEKFGVNIDGNAKVDFEEMIARSRDIAANMSKGIQYLFKKNKIEVISGFGKIASKNNVEVVNSEGESKNYSSKNIILATGARSKEVSSIKQDGKYIIGYKEAMSLNKQPESMIIVGSGAIGSEFANFYSSIGTQVTIIEAMPAIVPNEDIDVSKQLGRSLKKKGIKVMVSTSVQGISIEEDTCKVSVISKKGEESIASDIVFSAIGVTPNIENVGIKENNIELVNGKIKVDEFYKTNIDGVYAIGDIIDTPALAHVASAEAILCVEKINGLDVKPIDYTNIPSCTYTTPEIASVGLTEQQAKDKGHDVKVGKFPFTASGKASASGNRDGFVKVVFDTNEKILGAHLIGDNVTEMIAELVLAKEKNLSGKDILKTIHPHPTMSEAIMESVANAFNESIHI